jgi:hypothetical protein
MCREGVLMARGFATRGSLSRRQVYGSPRRPDGRSKGAPQRRLTAPPIENPRGDRRFLDQIWTNYD